MATYAPSYPKQLTDEAKETQNRREALLLKMARELETVQQWAETMRLTFENTDCRLSPEEQKAALKNCMEEAKIKTKQLQEEIRLLKDKMKRANEFESQTYKKAADEWFVKANKTLTTSGKNKLYLGNRQYVTAHAKSGPGKDKRYLDAGVWSWGVNLAWIEGGIDADVTFKIKFHPSDKFAGFPEGSLDEMMSSPRMSAVEWIKLCKKYPGSLLWQSEENRPTWFAKEVEAALMAGYHFVFGSTKSGDTKLTLET